MAFPAPTKVGLDMRAESGSRGRLLRDCPACCSLQVALKRLLETAKCHDCFPAWTSCRCVGHHGVQNKMYALLEAEQSNSEDVSLSVSGHLKRECARTCVPTCCFCCLRR